jgi:hypothetical protein
MQAEELAEINRSPQPPRDEARKINAEDASHAGTLGNWQQLVS